MTHDFLTRLRTIPEDDLIAGVSNDVAIVIGAIGLDHTVKLLNRCSGMRFYFPTVDYAFLKILRPPIQADRARGLTWGQLAAKYHISHSKARRSCKLKADG